LENRIALLVREAIAAVRSADPIAKGVVSAIGRNEIDETKQDDPESCWIGVSPLTLATVDALPQSVRRIRVSAKTVVTPAVKDWLKQRGILLERCASGKQATAPMVHVLAGVELVIADAEDGDRAVACQRQLALRGQKVDAVKVDQLVSRLQANPSLRAVLLSSLPALEVDRLCREASLCTVAVDSLALVSRIAARMAPRVWVIDSQQLTLSAMVSVAQACYTASRASLDGQQKGGQR
jgi:hypothetical protein